MKIEYLPVAVMNVIQSIYSSKHRFYHTLEHIDLMLNQLDELYKENPYMEIDYEIMRCAILFHDIVQQEKYSENKSAYIAELLLIDTDFEPNIVDIKRLINATDYSKAVERFDEKLIRDLDLFSLSLPYEQYRINTSLIRNEYDITDEQWIEGRKRFINQFLSFDKIYQTKYFEHLENLARDNLQKELNSYPV